MNFEYLYNSFFLDNTGSQNSVDPPKNSFSNNLFLAGNLHVYIVREAVQ